MHAAHLPQLPPLTLIFPTRSLRSDAQVLIGCTIRYCTVRSLCEERTICPVSGVNSQLGRHDGYFSRAIVGYRDRQGCAGLLTEGAHG